MRNMSFALTTPQFLDGTKDVTRRDGWADLKPGDRVCGVEKGMGLKKGEKVKRLGVIEIIANDPEPLNAITANPIRGERSEVEREGFPDMQPQEFVSMYCRHMGGPSTKIINRIEFKKVEARR